MEKKVLVGAALIVALFVGIGFAHFGGNANAGTEQYRNMESNEMMGDNAMKNLDGMGMMRMMKMHENMEELSLEEARELSKGMPCEKFMESMDEETFNAMKEMHEEMEREGMGMMGMMRMRNH